MDERYKIGMFAYMEFSIRKKTKYGEQITDISGHYEITETDPKNIEITDGQKTLIVTKRRITKFEQKKKP